MTSAIVATSLRILATKPWRARPVGTPPPRVAGAAEPEGYAPLGAPDADAADVQRPVAAEVSLNRILAAIGREVADVGGIANRLQDVLSPSGPWGGRIDRDCLQDLDLLTPRCGAVAAFLGALAPTLPAGWTGDAATAARAVTLSDVASRLAVQGPAVARGRAECAYELFEA